METCITAQRHRNSAFTRVDLLVIVVTLAILALTLFPALARMHTAPQGTQCLYNLRQITMGWWMYAEDSQGKLAASRGLLPANEDYENAYPRWVAGDMRGGIVAPQPGAVQYPGIDATNSALLVDPHYSQLADYVKNPTLYRCPSDQSTWSTTATPGRNEKPRVRSYSMNAAIGPSENGTLIGSGDVRGHWLSSGNSVSPGGKPWRVPIRVSDLVAPAPSQLWLLLDEHPESINDGSFAVEMPVNPASTSWVDIPAPYHNNGCNFSFADGHVEYHQWARPGNFPAVNWQPDTLPGLGGNQSIYANDPDILWLAHHTSAPAPGVNGVYQP